MIQTRDLPGVRARFLRADIENLAASESARKRGFTDFFNQVPQQDDEGRLARELVRYKAARDRYLNGEPPPEGESTFPGMAAFNFLSHLGDLALRLVNHALDQNPDAFALDEPDRGEEGVKTEGVACQLWETLARLQAEGRTVPAEAGDTSGSQPAIEVTP
jgi:hypothetical protein